MPRAYGRGSTKKPKTDPKRASNSSLTTRAAPLELCLRANFDFQPPDAPRARREHAESALQPCCGTERKQL